MLRKPIYHISFVYDGVRFEKDVFAFDFDISNKGCLTMYFTESGTIVIDTEKILWYEITKIS